jgi:hypothetical protein
MISGSNPNGAAACLGGQGGQGGRGGGGGGGAGGPSAAAARSGGSLTYDGTTTLTPGPAAAGGAGATNLGQGNPGDNGEMGASCNELIFDGSAQGMCVAD